MVYKEFFDKLAEYGSINSATVLDGVMSGSKIVYTDDEYWISGTADESFWAPMLNELKSVALTGITRIGETDLYTEHFQENPRLVILGCGHVGQALCRIAGAMKLFHITVMDDRKDLIKPELFPGADVLICDDWSAIPERIPTNRNTFYVSCTRSHACDEECVRMIMKRPFTYLGVLGSRSKMNNLRKLLLGEGYSEERIERIHCPVGIKLGGETPQEIALSILAEIIQERNRSTVPAVDEALRNAILADEPGVMVTIIDKQGSSPRSKGTRMWVGKTADGISYHGTVGGGSVEHAAKKDALDFFEAAASGGSSAFMIREYDPHQMVAALSDATGMSEEIAKKHVCCTAKITLMFEYDASLREKNRKKLNLHIDKYKCL